jgi:hypothetical protein
MYEAEAAERKRLNGIANAANLNNQDESREVPIMEPPEEKTKSIQKAATAFGVNRQYIADIKKINRESPEVFKKIEQGKISIPEGKQQEGANHGSLSLFRLTDSPQD